VPINDAGRLAIANQIRSLINGGSGWRVIPYTAGPSFDPAETDPSVYTTLTGAWVEGDYQRLTLDTAAGDYLHMLLAAAAALSWTASMSGTWPETVVGVIITSGDGATLVAVQPFGTPIVIPTIGSVLNTSVSYTEGELLP